MSLLNKIPENIVNIILEEQKNQEGEFIPNLQYLDKIIKKSELVIHFSHGEVNGFVFFYCNDKNFSYITLIAAGQKSRGKGVGRFLLESVINISKIRNVKKCKLEVRKKNKIAYGFYIKFGFTLEEDRGDKVLLSYKINYVP